MVDTIKFSQMIDGGDIDNNKKTPGLSGGANVLFNNPWTFLPSGTSAERPTPSPDINFRLRFNTDLQAYEFYDSVLGLWTQLQDSGLTSGPFITYTADPSIPDAQNLGLLADGLLKQTISLGIATLDIALNGTDYYGPGFVIPAADGGTGVNNGSNTLTLAGSLQTVGAFPVIFNFTGATDVIFPESGTLATTTSATITLTGDSGTATANAGNIDVLGGTTGLTFTGASDTLTLDGTLNIANGGTGVTSVTTSPTANAFAGWDANSNLSANSLLSGYTTTATAAGTTILTVGSTYWQYFTGTTTQTVTLPVTSTLVLGQSFYIVNKSSGAVTVQSSGANTVLVLAANSSAIFSCILTSGTTAASWNYIYDFNEGGSGMVSPGTANELAYYQATGTTVVGLASANNGVLVTDGSGVPSISSTLPSFTTDSITFNPTTGGIVGTTTNDNAAAGYVGEVISSVIQSGSAISLTAGIPANVTSIPLTAGDWDVQGEVFFTPGAGTTMSRLAAGISMTSATFTSEPTINGAQQSFGLTFTAGAPQSIGIPSCRISIPSTTTIYLIGSSSFGVNTISAFGNIIARRRR